MSRKPDFSCEVLEPADLAAKATVWDDLVSRAGYPPFMRAAFIGAALKVFGAQRGLLVLGREGDGLVFGAILTPQPAGNWVTYQPSQLPLGVWVMERGRDWQDVIQGVFDALGHRAMSIGITQQDPYLVHRPDLHARLELLDYVNTSWIEVDGSFRHYWESRGKNLKQNLRKQRRRLEESVGPVRFEFLTRPEELDTAYDDFAVLESRGWKAASGTAIAVGNDQGRFYSAMLAEMSSQGAAFALRLSVAGRPVAVDLGVRDGRTLVILKTTYDESLATYSPAQLLHESAFEFMFDNQLAGRIEFYGKVMEWHTRWTDKSRMLFHVTAYRWGWLRLLRAQLKHLSNLARRAGARGALE